MRKKQLPWISGSPPLLMRQSLFEQGVELRLIHLGKPTQDGFIKSFNAHFRTECLQEHGLSDILHAVKSFMTGSRTITSAGLTGRLITKQYLSLTWAGSMEKLKENKLKLLIDHCI